MNKLIQSRILTLLAAALTILAAYLLHPVPMDAPGGSFTGAWIVVVLGSLLLGAALWLRRTSSVGLMPTFTPGLPHPVPSPRWGFLLVGIFCLVLLAARSGLLSGVDALAGVLNIHVQMVLWLAGMVLVAIGAGALRRDQLRALQDWQRNHRRETAYLILILLAALVLRLIDLENSVHTLIDEFHIVKAINNLNNDPTIAILHPFDEQAAFTWVYPYFEMLVSNLVGHTFTGLRLTNALNGVLTIAVFYVFVRVTLNRQMATIGAILLATFPPHLHFSRLSFIQFGEPLIGLGAFTLLVMGLQERNPRFYALSGVLLGLLAYLSDGGKLLYPALVAAWLVWLRLYGRRKPLAGGVLWLVAMAAVVAAPVYYTLLVTGEPLLPRLDARLDTASITSLGGYLSQRLEPALLHLVHLPDSSGVYYEGTTGLLLPWVVPLFLLGVYHALWRPRGVGMFLLLWIGLALVGYSLLADPTWTSRYVVIFPALVLLVTVGLWHTARLFFERSMAEYQPVLTQILLTLIVLGIAASQVIYYFGPHLERYRTQAPLWQDYVDIAFRVEDLPPNYEIHIIYGDVLFDFHYPLIFDYWGIPPVDLHAVDYREWHLADTLALPPEGDYAFFVDSRATNIVDQLAQVWRLGAPHRSPYNIPPQKQLYLYLAPALSRQAGPLP